MFHISVYKPTNYNETDSHTQSHMICTSLFVYNGFLTVDSCHLSDDLPRPTACASAAVGCDVTHATPVPVLALRFRMAWTAYRTLSEYFIKKAVNLTSPMSNTEGTPNKVVLVTYLIHYILNDETPYVWTQICV